MMELTPNQHLARKIAERLVAESLINAAKRAELETGLGEGTLGPDAWRVLVELTVDREGRQ
jgi:hypothetical protein